jgi:peptide/nickel transport system permease protein
LLLIKLRATVELTLGGLIVGLLLSFPLGILSAVRRGSWIDRLSSYFVALTYALPTFWLGLLLVIVFSLWLKWFPPSGRLEFGEDPLQALRLLVLPSLTIGLYFASILARFLKSSLLEVLSQDYMRTARAKGLPEWMVIYRHALKNALIPVVTVLGLQLGTLLGGAVVAEAIFNWPGLGSTLLHAILIRDYATVQATMLLIVTIFIAINLITDIIYAFLDPRIRYQ